LGATLSGKRTALIATLPKSGTWYAHTFFWCYDQLLRNSEDYLTGNFQPDLTGALRDSKINDWSSHGDTFGIDTLFIIHTLCPGFQELGDLSNAEQKALYVPFGYNHGESLIRDMDKWEELYPMKNPLARIVYLYRNPLDHFVSYYRHTLNHKDDSHRLKILPDGQKQPITDLRDFVFNAGALGAFIKHYSSFLRMKEAFPQQVLLMPYERLTTQPETAFSEVMAFLNIPVHTQLFHDALKMCSKQSLMKIEAAMGRSIVADQTKSSEKHIRDGKVGKWQEHFSAEDIERIEAVFNAFGISLKDFIITEASETTASLPVLELDPLKARDYQIAFLRQQLAWTGIQTAALRNDLVKIKSQMRAFQLFKRSPAAAPLRALIRAYRKLRQATNQQPGTRNNDLEAGLSKSSV
jgi:hypothetical protein